AVGVLASRQPQGSETSLKSVHCRQAFEAVGIGVELIGELCLMQRLFHQTAGFQIGPQLILLGRSLRHRSLSAKSRASCSTLTTRCWSNSSPVSSSQNSARTNETPCR